MLCVAFVSVQINIISSACHPTQSVAKVYNHCLALDNLALLILLVLALNVVAAVALSLTRHDRELWICALLLVLLALDVLTSLVHLSAAIILERLPLRLLCLAPALVELAQNDNPSNRSVFCESFIYKIWMWSTYVCMDCIPCLCRLVMAVCDCKAIESSG